jgi:TetR/AcrR family transcriptional regulator, cholesterol catabolism regulator
MSATPDTATGLRGTPASEPAVGTTADRLLQTAATLFREKGYNATTTRELSERLGIQKGSLYHHVRGKEDLLVAISLESLRWITAAVAPARFEAEPANRLEAMIAAHVEAALDNRDMHTTMLVELRALSPDRRAQVLEQRDAYEQLIKDVISEEQEAGRLRFDIDAKHLTLALLNLLNWTIFWYDPDGPDTPVEIAAMLSSVFLGGARPR